MRSAHVLNRRLTCSPPSDPVDRSDNKDSTPAWLPQLLQRCAEVIDADPALRRRLFEPVNSAGASPAACTRGRQGRGYGKPDRGR